MTEPAQQFAALIFKKDGVRSLAHGSRWHRYGYNSDYNQFLRSCDFCPLKRHNILALEYGISICNKCRKNQYVADRLSIAYAG